MPEYRIVFGAYVRMYADHTVTAASTDAARKLAIEEFKTRASELPWCDPQYDNLALPSIVTLEVAETRDDVLGGYDFPITSADARQYAADKMLEALEFVRMTFADIEASKRKGYYTECPKVVAEAIADATLVKEPA